MRKAKDFQDSIDSANDVLVKNVDVLTYFMFPFQFMEKLHPLFEKIKHDYVFYMKTMDEVCPFDGDEWRPEIKFFSEGALDFFGRFIEISKVYNEGLEDDGTSYNSLIVDAMKVEGIGSPREGYVKFVDSVIKTFLLAHFCASETRENEEEGDDRLRTILRYARAVSSVYEESCFKFDKDVGEESPQ